LTVKKTLSNIGLVLVQISKKVFNRQINKFFGENYEKNTK
jgi:hypothetical protein